MPIPAISLAQFNRIASGKYNAGLVDFETDDHGNLTGELSKVNNHVHKVGENKAVLSEERILEVKEAFINALVGGGVAPEKIAEIRAKLGISENASVVEGRDEYHGKIVARFQPLTRQQVRELLDDYAKSGRGFTQESMRAVSLDDAEKAIATQRMGKSRAAKRDAVNTQLAQAAQSRKGNQRFALGDAFALLATGKSLANVSKVIGKRFDGPDAANQRQSAETGVRNQFMVLFQQALKLLDGAESDAFTLFGMKAKLVKGQDGNVTAELGEGTLRQRVALGGSAATLFQHLMGRAVADTGMLGQGNLKLLLDKVFSRDVEGFLTGEDRTSLTRMFASTILMKKTNSPEKMEVEFLDLMNGAYNTGTLVEVANLALEGQVATKADIDRLHGELAKNNAGLDDEMKAMLARVAGMPIEPVREPGFTYQMVVGQKPIVADLGEVANAMPIPKAPPVGVVPRDEIRATATDVKNFIADFIFSDETMVSDVVVNLPGETMRNIFADDRKIAIFAKIIQAPEILDIAVAPTVAAVVKEGFAQMTAVLDAAWQAESLKATNSVETLAAAAGKSDFLLRFSQFVRDDAKLPGKELAKFDAIIQTMATQGCKALQGFINKVFQIDTNAVRNAQGGFTIEPYKDLSPEQIKAQIDAKSLNQILDDAAAADSASPGQVALFRQVLSSYFSDMARPSDRRSVFASALRYADVFNFEGMDEATRESANKAATAKFTGAILKGTSPLLQKMMQGLPRTVLGEYAEALDDMKSRLSPIPRRIVQAHLMKLIDDSNGKIKSIKLRESLGAASVGEAFLCDFTYTDENNVEKTEKMVVKIMRHDAEERVKREADVFTAAAAKIGPGMLKTWQGQLEQYKTEFDFRNEVENVKTGAALYDVKGNADHPYRAIGPNVSSMKVSKLDPSAKNVMVCTLAPGDTADSLFAQTRRNIQSSLDPVFERDNVTGRLKWDPQTRKPIFKKPLGFCGLSDASLFCDNEYTRLLDSQKKLQQAAGVWLSEALLGSGKFHGDAHAGNLMVSDQGVTFIDFGNLYELKTHYELGENGQPLKETVEVEDENGEKKLVERDKVKLDERVELLRLILGSTLRDSDCFLKGFERLLSESGRQTLEANREKAKAIIDAVLAKGAFSFDVCYRLQGALTELQKLGLEMPPQINCFVQSMTRLQNTIAEMNSILAQTSAVIDALKVGPGAGNIVGPVDPLDPMGEILALQASPEGQELVPIPVNPAFDGHEEEDLDENGNPKMVPAFLAKALETGYAFGTLDDQNGPFQTTLRNSLVNAPDKPAEVRRIMNLVTRHYDPVNFAQVIADFNSHADGFARDWAAAETDEARNALIDDFVNFHSTNVRRAISANATGIKNLILKEHPAPSTFAKVVMGALFNGAAAADKMFRENFSIAEKLKLGVDATAIATGELNVSKMTLAGTLMPWYKGPGADEIVMQAIVDDTNNMGGDKSYQINIGI